jgi:D-3-phosphoglycerate dehydrogenase / 2-oxoglutarate reductase
MSGLRVLANDGIDPIGKAMLEEAGFVVDTNKIAQDVLAEKIGAYDVLIVRSATKVNAAIIDAGNSLKLVARAGVGLDNIDVRHAGLKNVGVVNTPAASSRSVAELVFAHLFTLCRSLQITNRVMPSEGATRFNELKKQAASGIELAGKTLGIIGFGRIGQEVARMAIGLGMDVLVNDYKERSFDLVVTFNRKYAINNFQVTLPGMQLDEVLKQSDFVTLHVPGGGEEIIGAKELAMMKVGSGLINCSRGGVVNEPALLQALTLGHLAYAGIDVFETEPPVNTDILQPDQVSLSPHIGASTKEAQERIGIELAERIIAYFR